MTDFAEINGIRVRYEHGGDKSKPAIVLSNSMSTSLEMWNPQWADLCKEFQVLRYDTRGHGQTDAPADAYTMTGLADDLLALMDAVGIEKAHFVGLSLGGMIAQQIAVMRPERVRSLCLIATTAKSPGGDPRYWNARLSQIKESQTFEVVLPLILDKWLTMKFRRDHPKDFAFLSQFILDTPVDGYIGGISAIRDFDILDKIHEIAVPTLVIEGEEDSSTTVEDGKAIVARIPNSELRIIPNKRHILNWEAKDTIDAWLFDWLRAQTAGA